jgi:translation initiation factor 2 beta subunit (eIF-2beta)/eIF-5
VNDSPLAELISGHIINLIAYYGKFSKPEEIENISMDKKLTDLGVNDDGKTNIISQIEDGLKELKVDDKTYSLKIKKEISDIITVSDLIEAIINAMSDVVRQVSSDK